jgi:hypothetical protein
MISFNDLSYRYGKKTPALESITADIPEGIYLLLGENGAGKTTLLHLIAGLLKAIPEGACTLDGAPTALREPSVLTRTFFYSDEIPFPYRTIRQMVRHHAVFYPSFDPEMLEQNLADFEMTGNEPIDQFSLGNRKKAQLAYVLALHTDVLLLDEPANGLDITSRTKLLRMMARCVSENQTVIISTHTVWDFQNLFDGLLVLGHGRLLVNMPIWEIASRVRFVHSPAPVEGAIYQEPEFGRFKAIVPNTAADETTDVDFVVLYNALQSPASRNLVELLSAPES